MKRSRLRRVSKKRAAQRQPANDFRMRVLLRDHARCRACRTYWGYLDVHHVVKRSAAPRRVMDLDNAVTLCRACHDRTDWPYAKGRLVATAQGAGRFTFQIVYARDKFSLRSAGLGG